MNTNPLFDPATDNAPISDESQKIVNEPVEDSAGISDEDQQFLDQLIKLIDDGKINLYQAETLLNKEVYDGLPDEGKGKIDQMSFNMLTTVREIHGFNASEFTNNSFQFKNMIHKLKMLKEEAEKEHGDVFIF